MEYVTLQNSSLLVSRLCLGGCPMGQYGWGEVIERELIKAVHSAIDNGINFFDTADVYGLGNAEKILGKALGAKRRNVVIASKFGVRVASGKTFYDNSPKWIQTALQSSLSRLKTDYIDLYQIHYRDAKTPIDDLVDALDRMKARGLIRYYGLSNIHAADFFELRGCAGRFISMQDEFSLACRKNEEDLSMAAMELHVTPMTWGSLGQGVLTGKYDGNTAFGSDDRRSRDAYVNFHGEKLRHNMRIVSAMRPIAQRHHVPIAAVALRFILDHIKGSVALVGAKRPSQILGCIKSMDWALTHDEKRLLDAVSA